MHPIHRRHLSAFAVAVIACASLIGAAGSANAATSAETPSDLSVSLLSPHTGATTGANITYTSVSGWRNTNVVVTLPGWTALNPFATTGSAACPASITVSAKSAGGAKPTSSECTWTQASGSAHIFEKRLAGGVHEGHNQHSAGYEVRIFVRVGSQSPLLLHAIPERPLAAKHFYAPLWHAHGQETGRRGLRL